LIVLPIITTIMSNSVETLEASFRNSEAKLNLVLCQLEDCFAKYDADQQKYGDSDNNSEAPISLNPVKIISALKAITSELQEVKQDFRELQEYKETVSHELEEKTEGINKLIGVTIDSLKT